MENPEKILINIYDIDLSDRSYIFTFEPIISQMIESIKNIDLISPPILEQVSDKPRYRIVSGFKRIIALKHLRENYVEAYVYLNNSTIPDLNLFLRNLYENISIRQLNLIEKSIILNKLILTYHVSETEILEKFLPLLELGKNIKVLEILLPLVKLEDNLKIAVIEDFIAADFAARLLSHSAEDRQAIFNLFWSLKLGKNRQKEFYRLLNDIAHIKSKPIRDIINQESIQFISKNTLLTVSQKVSKMKEELRKQRYPRLTEKEMKFEQLKKEMKLPPHIIFRPPQFFESDKYSLEIIFKNKDEFESALNILNKLSTIQNLESINE